MKDSRADFKKLGRYDIQILNLQDATKTVPKRKGTIFKRQTGKEKTKKHQPSDFSTQKAK